MSLAEGKPKCYRLPDGKAAFARGCLAPASKSCKGVRPFQPCRRSYIRRCRLDYECERPIGVI